MGKSNVYQLPSEAVTIYLDRYCAQRLLLALTQALEGGQYDKKKKKNGKGGNGKPGMKLSKKGYKSSAPTGLKLSKTGGKSSPPQKAAPVSPLGAALKAAVKALTK